MQSKLKDLPYWSLVMKYGTMNLYQYHLTGQADDTCHFEVFDLRGNRFIDFALQTKVRWLKNIREEQGSPDQIVLVVPMNQIGVYSFTCQHTWSRFLNNTYYLHTCSLKVKMIGLS
jgi:hypothetical protein